MTGLDYLSTAFREIGVLGEGQTASGAQAADGLAIAQRMIDAFGADGLTMYQLLRIGQVISDPTIKVYSIGAIAGADIGFVRPDALEAAAWVRVAAALPVHEIPIEVLTEQRWIAQTPKGQAGEPVTIYYDRGWGEGGLGYLYMWPVPNVAGGMLVLYFKQAIVAFSDLSATDFTFPNGYQAFFHHSLVLLLADAWGKPVTPRMEKNAYDAKDVISRRNVAPRELLLDRALLPEVGGYDIQRGPG